MDHFQLELQAALAITEAFAEVLNREGAKPEDFEDDQEIFGFYFTPGEGWLCQPVTSETSGSVCYEDGAWVASHQEHD